MYSYLFFGLTMAGIFSTIENLKGGPRYSNIKICIILLLILMTIGSLLDFLNEFGYSYGLLKSIFGFTTFLTFINLVFFIANPKIPKPVIVFEVIVYIFFTITYILGYRSFLIINGEIKNQVVFLEKVKFLIKAGFFLSSIVYNLNIIYKKNHNNNLYRLKIKKWTIFLIVLLFVVVLIMTSGALLYYKKISFNNFDSRFIVLLIRVILLLFISFRPKYLDDSIENLKINQLFVKQNVIAFEDFEFLFYKNHYYLNINASLEDFALKLNQSKEEVSDYIKSELELNFTELVNQNRVEYLQQLLRSKKYESFTIEALSEMSGFGTRRSMYNYFNKYVGMTPSEFIHTIN
jgi:AraC-like DNA-binding protein